MTLPNVNLKVVDGGLGVVAPNTDQLAAVMGPSSSGAVDAPALFTSSAALVSAYGYGPGVSLAVSCMETSGLPVLFVRTATDTPGAAGAVTPSNLSGALMTVTAIGGGTAHPYDRAELLVTVAPGSSTTIGTGVVRVSLSLDGGLSSLGTYVLQAGNKVTISTLGVDLNWGSGTVAVGDTYACTFTAPTSTATSVIAAISAVAALAAPVPAMFFDAGERTEAECVSLETKMSAIAVSQSTALPARLVTSALTTETASQLDAEFAPYSGIHVGVGGGSCRMYDYTQLCYPSRPFAWPAMARFVSTNAHTDAGEVALGPLPGVLSVTDDQRISPTLDTARFISAITFRGLQGYYIANPNLMAPNGSDYSLMQYGRVMDKICRTVRTYFLHALSSSVRLNPATGYILEKDAQSLEQGCDAALRAVVIADGDVSSVATQVSRTDNISATKTINVTVRAVPLGYLKQINVTLSFVNPANAQPTA